MTTSTFYGSEEDGTCQNYKAVGDNLGTDWRGTGTWTHYHIDMRVGESTGEYQYKKYTQDEGWYYKGYTKFVTSDIPDGDSITSATLSCYLWYDGSTYVDFVNEADIANWGDTLDEATDFTLSGTAVASISTNGIGATMAYKDFTSNGNFVSNVSKTGTTYLVIHSTTTPCPNDPEPTGSGFGATVTWLAGSYTGTDKDPKLTVVHSGNATYTKSHSVDSRRKKESFTRNDFTGTSGTKITIDNSESGGDKFSDVKP